MTFNRTQTETYEGPPLDAYEDRAPMPAAAMAVASAPKALAVAPTAPEPDHNVMERVLIGGDLSKLNEADRIFYYTKVCESVGLNPLTKPFEYIELNRKLVLYARREATDQLRAIHGVSVTELIESEREGVFVVTAKVQNRDGRTDAAKGAINIKGLTGEPLANALMKAETKAKRRATLSICGLGLLDETELDSISEPMPNITPAERSDKTPFKTAAARKQFHESVVKSYGAAQSIDELAQIAELNGGMFAKMAASGDERDELSLGELNNQYEIFTSRLLKTVDCHHEDDFRIPPVHQETEMPKFLEGRGKA